MTYQELLEDLDGVDEWVRSLGLSLSRKRHFSAIYP